jgi:glycerol-3-phosphate acyltransferase PlsY
MLEALLLIVGAYLMGSVSTAVVVTRLMGLPDPRTLGSGNPGATNVLRYGGRRAALATLVGDAMKGYLPVALAAALEVSPPVLGATAVAAFVGHLYPVFFGFQGGKGVATSLGVLLGLAWPLGVAALATWLLVALLTRYSSLAALTAAALAPFYTAWIVPQAPVVAATAVVSLLLLWRHRANIRRLLEGKESRIGQKASGAVGARDRAGPSDSP